jgi:DNA polymerase-3 subunit beta
MIFKVNSSELQRRLSAIASLVPTKSVLPIIQNVHFDLKEGLLHITGTDLEITLRTSLPVSVEDTEGTFNIALPPKILLDIIKAMPDQPLEFRLPTGTLTVEVVSSTGTYKITGQEGLDFPGMAFSDDAASFKIPTEVLLGAVSKTIFAASTDDLKPAMTGIFLESKAGLVNFVTTDAHRLVRYRRTDLKDVGDLTLLLPSKAMRAMTTAADGVADNMTVVHYNNNSARFSFGETQLVTRLIDARFPDYENVIPGSSPNRLQLAKKELMGTLKRLDIFANKTTHLARFNLSPNQIAVESKDLDLAIEGQEVLNCIYEDNEMEIGFNLQQMVEIIDNVDTDDLLIELGTSNRAAVVKPIKQSEGEDLLMLVMPVMLSSY